MYTKQQLFINQIEFKRLDIKQQLEHILEEKNLGHLPGQYYINAKSRLRGVLNALELDETKDIEEQLLTNLNIYHKAEKSLTIDILKETDQTKIGIFYFIGGAITHTLILLTASDNPQSCCPKNKALILNKI